MKQALGAVMRDVEGAAGVRVGLTACLHSSLETGFKRTKREEVPPSLKSAHPGKPSLALLWWHSVPWQSCRQALQ